MRVPGLRPSSPDARRLALLGASQSVLGVGSYALLTVAGRSLGPQDFGQLTLFWSVSFSLGLGIFGPYEQLVARAMAHGGDRNEVRRLTALFGAVGSVAAIGVLLVLGGYLPRGSAAGQMALGWATALHFPVLFILARQRGLAAGSRILRPYALQASTDGVVRGVSAMLAAAGVAAVVWSSATGWMWTVIVAGLCGMAVAAPGLRAIGRRGPAEPGGQAVASGRYSRTVSDAIRLAGVLTISIVLANSLPAVAAAVGATDDQVGSFGAAVVLARIPLFFIGLVVPVVMPRVAAMSPGDVASYRAYLRSLVGVLVVLATVLTVVIGVAVGPAVLLLFGADYVVPTYVPWLLGLSTAALLWGMAVQSVLTASFRLGAASWAWLSAAVVFAIAVSLGGEPLWAVSVASAISGTWAAVTVTVLAWRGRPWGEPGGSAADTLVEFD